MATGDLKILEENASGGFDEVTKVQSTSTEIDTGTEASKLVAPDQLKASKRGRQIFVQSSTPTGMATGDIWFDTT